MSVMRLKIVLILESESFSIELTKTERSQTPELKRAAKWLRLEC